MAQTAVEAWIEEGMAKGEAKGLEKGRVEGQLSTARTILRTLLEDRFSALPLELVQRINTVTDLERLQAAIRQVSRVARLEDFQL